MIAATDDVVSTESQILPTMKQEGGEMIAIKSEDINLYRPFEAFALDTIPETLIKVNVSLEMAKGK